MTRPWQNVATVPTDDGALELRQRGSDEFLIVIAGRVLMTNSNRRSEQTLATLACAALATHAAPRILVGGLGMGYTLRAALDVLPAAARVEVSELTPAVVDWCRGPLAPLTGSAISDPRVRVVVGDVAHRIASAAPGSYDAILLDLYEGPYSATQHREDPFYGPTALARSRKALVPGGSLAIWAEDGDSSFTRRFAASGFVVTTHRSGHGGRSHVVYLGGEASSLRVGAPGPRYRIKNRCDFPSLAAGFVRARGLPARLLSWEDGGGRAERTRSMDPRCQGAPDRSLRGGKLGLGAGGRTAGRGAG